MVTTITTATPTPTTTERRSTRTLTLHFWGECRTQRPIAEKEKYDITI